MFNILILNEALGRDVIPGLKPLLLLFLPSPQDI